LNPGVKKGTSGGDEKFRHGFHESDSHHLISAKKIVFRR